MQKVEAHFFIVGHCYHPEFMTLKGGSWNAQRFPALVALIKHPTFGYILFDTGYSERFFSGTKRFPFTLLKKITPVEYDDAYSLPNQLKKMNIKTSDITAIFISHFHPDHIGGLKDYPNARFICSESAYDTVKNCRGIKALLKGYLPNCLPEDFSERVEYIEDKPKRRPNVLAPFKQGFDILGDGSLLAISLPGHAQGQFGLYLETTEHKKIFLIADSCWSRKAYQHKVLPNWLTYLIHHNRKAYQKTIIDLNQLYLSENDVHIIPSHCHESCQALMEVEGE